MKRWIPSPLLSGLLLASWLLLNQSMSAGNLLIGSIVAIGLPLLAHPLLAFGYPRPRRPLVLFRLLGMALVEIVRSCFNVSRIILFANKRVNSQFIRVPLDLRDPYGLALLSCLINTTPGTVWVELISDTNELVLHVFDLYDEQWWIHTIKTRYESPLIEIFEGGPAP